MQRVSHGVYLRNGTDPTLVEPCRALGLVVPGDVGFSHVTAGRLMGMPGWGVADPRVHLARPPRSPALRRGDVVQHRCELRPEDRWTVAELTVTSPGRTLFDLSAHLRLDRLVCVGDYCLRHLGVTSADLEEIVEAAEGRRGIRRLRQALPLMDARAEYPPESLVRVWCRLARLPRLEPQGEVWDGDALIATVDLLDDEH